MNENFDKLKGERSLHKRANLGFAQKHDKHCTILNRLIDFFVSKNGPIMLHEPDPRHVELLLEHLDLDGTTAKGVSTPAEKPGTYHDRTELEKPKLTLFRSCVWHAECPTHDRTLEPSEKSCAVLGYDGLKSTVVRNRCV